MTTMRRRAAAAAMAGALLGATTLLGGPSAQVGAAPLDSDTLVLVPYAEGDQIAFVRNGQLTKAPSISAGSQAFEGDFSVAPGTDVFLYGIGDHPDGIHHVEPDGTGVASSFRPEVVRGSYDPLVGDFDGNGIDDIFWYGVGPRLDTVWLFQPDGSHVTVGLPVNGVYLPFVMDVDGDGIDDIVWYGYLTDPDSMWLFAEGGTHTTRALRVDGAYIPLVGHFAELEDPGQEQVVWYAPEGPDAIWTFTPYGKVSRPLPPVDGAEPVVGDFTGTGEDAIFWYKAGGGPEALTAFNPEGNPSYNPAPQVSGSYVPVAGDFDGDGDDGIAWFLNGRAFIWSFDSQSTTGYTQIYVDSGERWTYPFVARSTGIAD